MFIGFILVSIIYIESRNDQNKYDNIKKIKIFDTNISTYNLSAFSIINISLFLQPSYYDPEHLNTYTPKGIIRPDSDTCMYERNLENKYAIPASYGQRNVVHKDGVTYNENICNQYIYDTYGINISTGSLYWEDDDFLSCEDTENFIGVYCKIDNTQVLNVCLTWDSISGTNYTCDYVDPNPPKKCCESIDSNVIQYNNYSYYYIQAYPNNMGYILTDAGTGISNTTLGGIVFIYLGNILESTQTTCHYASIDFGHYPGDNFTEQYHSDKNETNVIFRCIGNSSF